MVGYYLKKSWLDVKIQYCFFLHPFFFLSTNYRYVFTQSTCWHVRQARDAAWPSGILIFLREARPGIIWTRVTVYFSNLSSVIHQNRGQNIRGGKKFRGLFTQFANRLRQKKKKKSYSHIHIMTCIMCREGYEIVNYYSRTHRTTHNGVTDTSCDLFLL